MVISLRYTDYIGDVSSMDNLLNISFCVRRKKEGKKEGRKEERMDGWMDGWMEQHG